MRFVVWFSTLRRDTREGEKGADFPVASCVYVYVEVAVCKVQTYAHSLLLSAPLNLVPNFKFIHVVVQNFRTV